MPHRSQSNPLDRPTYSIAEAARLVGMSTNRVSRWLSGYSYNYDGAQRQQRPVLRRPGTSGTSYASFLDLVDMLWVKNFLERGFSLQKLRDALDEVVEILGEEHFARRSFFTHGQKIYLEVKKEGRAILELLSGGQWVISDIIVEVARQIEFDKETELAKRWFPPGHNKVVVLDPLVSFGRPHIHSKGIATSNVFDFYQAEGSQVRPACRWFDLSQREVVAAVTFEEQFAA